MPMLVSAPDWRTSGQGLSTAAGPARRRAVRVHGALRLQYRGIEGEVDAAHVSAEDRSVVEPELVEPFDRTLAPQRQDLARLSGGLGQVPLGSVAELGRGGRHRSHRPRRLGVGCVRRDHGKDATVLGPVVAQPEAPVGLDLGERLGFGVEEHLVVGPEPDREQPVDARDHAARIAARPEPARHAHVGSCLLEAERHLELGRAAAADQFEQVEGRDRVEVGIVELVGQLQGAGERAPALDDAPRRGAAGDMGVTGDEARQEDLTGGVDPSIAPAPPSLGDLDDPVAAHDHAVVAQQLERTVPVAQHPAGLDHDGAPAGRGLE